MFYIIVERYEKNKLSSSQNKNKKEENLNNDI